MRRMIRKEDPWLSTNYLIVFAFFLLSLIPVSTLAHPVNAIDPQQVKSRAEVHIEEDRIRLILEIDQDDARLFTRLLPEEWLTDPIPGRETEAERVSQFALEDFRFIGEDGRPLQIASHRIAIQLRLLHDATDTDDDTLPADTSIARAGLFRPADFKTILYAELVYAMPRRLERITIIPPSTKNLPINEVLTDENVDSQPSADRVIGFIAYHKNQPVNDLNYLKRQETLDLNWQDTWRTHFIDSELVRHDAIALASYLYIEPEEIRHYIIVRVKELSDLLQPPLTGREFIDASEWDTLKTRVGELLLGQNSLSVNGQILTPALEQSHFVDFDESGGVMLLKKTRRLDFAGATVGIELVYQPPDTPVTGELLWQLFPGNVSAVAIAMHGLDGSTVVSELTEKKNRLSWQNETGRVPLEIKALDVTEPADYKVPVASVICLVLLIPVAWWLSVRHRDDQPILLQLSMAGLLLWAGGALAPYWPLSIPKPPGLAPVISDQQADQLLEQLLRNTYQAFDSSREDVIRSKLAPSVSSEILDSMYRRIAESLTIEQLDDSRQARIKQLTLIRTSVKPLVDRPLGFSFDARWQVSVIAGQWDDIYDRNILYDALISIEPVAGIWKISSFDLLDRQTTAQPAAPSSKE